MAILITSETKVLCQGMTGRTATFHCARMQSYGTQLVAGVTPGKGGRRHLDLPFAFLVKGLLDQLHDPFDTYADVDDQQSQLNGSYDPGTDTITMSGCFEDRDGALWVGSYGEGLWRLLDGDWTKWTDQDGLGDNYIYAILQGRQTH